MPYPFTLSTTSQLTFQNFLSSPTHPQLPFHASIARHAFRIALKRYRKAPSSQKTDELLRAKNAVEEYLSWLFVLVDGAGYRIHEGGNRGDFDADVEVVVHEEIEAEWSPVLLNGASKKLHLSPLKIKTRQGAKNSARAKYPGLAYELAFTLTTYAAILSNIARNRYLRTLYASTTPSPERKTSALQSCIKELTQAASIHAFLSASPHFSALAGPGIPSDVNPTAQSGLKELAMAEATLLSITKDDSYLSACIQMRNRNDTDWMIKAPEIPRVRTLLFARICVRAGELAESAVVSASAGMGTGMGVGEKDELVGMAGGLLGYVSVLTRVARARACRFFGIEAEERGATGEAIAWLRAAKALLAPRKTSSSSSPAYDRGMTMSPGSEMIGAQKLKEKGRLGFKKWKDDWKERREERRMEKDAGDGGVEGVAGSGELDAGDDAGRMEEVKVLVWLGAKWDKINSTVNIQPIPPHSPLLSQLPSGRDILPPLQRYVPEPLSHDRLEGLRGASASPGFVSQHQAGWDAESSGEEEDVALGSKGGELQRNYY